MSCLQSAYRNYFCNWDWVLLLSILPLVGAGLVTMHSFTSESYFFDRQLMWVGLAFLAFAGASFVDWRFLRRSGVVASIFVLGVVSLALLYFFGDINRRTFDLFLLSVQPAEFVKLALVIILAKFFSRRHVAIFNIKYIILSGFYAFLPFVLIFLQPDLGSAMIIFFIWLGLIMVSGVSKKHLFLVFLVGSLVFGGLWVGVFHDYQKDRILSFVNPMADIQGTGYHAFQSTVAVGSGRLLGQGVGYGSQSRLKFLPEHQTDFIFAAFAEEWGFVGVVLLFIFFGLVTWRILVNALYGASNFEVFFGVGLAIIIISHFIIHVGMNIGLLPITGLPMPFMSYGGSHLLANFLGLGVLNGMRRYSLVFHREDMKNEFLGLE